MDARFPSAQATCILPVKDMERARRFYGQALGLEVVGHQPDGKFVDRCGGTEIALFPKPEGNILCLHEDIEPAARGEVQRGCGTMRR